MFPLPNAIIALLNNFACVFSPRVWSHALVLLTGALLTPGQRTVAAALRIMGLAQEKHFINYHRVLSRARWCGLTLSRLLLLLLVQTFAPTGALVFGVDDTLERRRGKQIKAKGIYRDAVRSSHSFFVKASGLRWLSVMLLAPIPWAGRCWGLPVLTLLAPSERYHHQRQQRHKTLPDWARQAMLQIRRWLPERQLVMVADSGFAVIAALAALSQRVKPILCISRLRLDAALYAPASKRRPKQRGRTRLKGARLPTLNQVLRKKTTMWSNLTTRVWYGEFDRTIEYTTSSAVWYHSGQPPLPIRWVLVRDPLGKFEPQALLCTDLTIEPAQIIEWYARRWQVEVTFHEVRAHLGVETQRQWSDLAIARTTPILFGLFSLVTLLAHELCEGQTFVVRQAAWYVKTQPTFADALALVRTHLWHQIYFHMSRGRRHNAKLTRALVISLSETLAYAN